MLRLKRAINVFRDQLDCVGGSVAETDAMLYSIFAIIEELAIENETLRLKINELVGSVNDINYHAVSDDEIDLYRPIKTIDC